MNSMLNIPKTRRGFPVDMSVINDLWVSSILETNRFRTVQDRILARYESVGADGEFYPSEERLAELGVNLNSLATCLDTRTISAERVGELVADLEAGRIDAEQFDDTVALTLVPAGLDLSAEDALTAASHLPDVLTAARMYPNDHLERALYAQGLDSSRVEYVA